MVAVRVRTATYKTSWRISLTGEVMGNTLSGLYPVADGFRRAVLDSGLTAGPRAVAIDPVGWNVCAVA